MNQKKLKMWKTPRYKIVKRKTRYSCIIPGSSKYGIKYLPGKVVYALPGTLGIMTFKIKTAAQNWRYSHYTIENNTLIIKVLPMGRGIVEPAIAFPDDIKMFYEDIKGYSNLHNRILPPKGTICYPAVYVVD